MDRKRTVTVYFVRDEAGDVIEHVQDQDSAEEIAESIGGDWYAKEMDPDDAESLFE